jgi:hypothetical protein
MPEFFRGFRGAKGLTKLGNPPMPADIRPELKNPDGPLERARGLRSHPRHQHQPGVRGAAARDATRPARSEMERQDREEHGAVLGRPVRPLALAP